MDKIITIEKKDGLNTLHKVSRETTQQEVDDLNLKERLRASNSLSWTDGCGLAAIQIGVPLRYAWFIIDGKEEELLNPVILTCRGTILRKEGCLSIPNKWTMVERSLEIEYISHGKKRRAKGFKANVIQHEIDHMVGILNTDKEKKNESKPM